MKHFEVKMQYTEKCEGYSECGLEKLKAQEAEGKIFDLKIEKCEIGSYKIIYKKIQTHLIPATGPIDAQIKIQNGLPKYLVIDYKFLDCKEVREAEKSICEKKYVPRTFNQKLKAMEIEFEKSRGV